MRLGGLVFLAALASGCGYHVGGRADLLPKNIKTIAVPAFFNNTTRYKLAARLASDVSRELISRTRYRVVSDANQADAVLQGSIVMYNSYPVVFDPATGRASGVLISVVMQVTLRERASGKVLFSRPNFEAKERYEIAVDQRAYFEESDTAIQRLAREVARGVVSAVLEGF